MDSTFEITLLIVLLSGLWLTYLQRRQKDRCLKSFEGSPVLVKLQSGKKVWGTLRVEAGGIELMYKEPHRDQQGHSELSMIFYKSEFKEFEMMMRLVDELDEREKRKRERQLRRISKRRFFSRLLRGIKNFISSIRDTVMEILQLVSNRTGKVLPSQLQK